MTAQAFSERDIIRGGRPLQVTLITGEQVDYRLSMDSLAALEDAFGSLTHMQDQLTEANRALAAGEGPQVAAGKVKMMAVVTDLVAIGLRHVPYPDPMRAGVTVRLGKDRDLVGELLDPGRLQEYMTTVGTALQQAFGAMTPEGSANPPTPPPAPSPGPGGGTSSPSSGAVPMPPFGI
jgi:hypothetical protein